MSEETAMVANEDGSYNKDELDVHSNVPAAEDELEKNADDVNSDHGKKHKKDSKKDRDRDSKKKKHKREKDRHRSRDREHRREKRGRSEDDENESRTRTKTDDRKLEGETQHEDAKPIPQPTEDETSWEVVAVSHQEWMEGVAELNGETNNPLNSHEVDKEQTTGKDLNKPEIKDAESSGSDREKVRERERVKNRDRDRSRDRDRDRDRRDRRYSDLDRRRGDFRDNRYRDRDDRYRRDDRGRDRDGRDKRRSSRSRSRSRRRRSSPVPPFKKKDHSRERSRSRGKDRSRERKEDKKDGDKDTKKPGAMGVPGLPTLKEIMIANPGLSVAEALQKQTAIKNAMDMGLSADLLSQPGGALSLLNVPGLIMGQPSSNKIHRELYIGNLPPGILVPQITEFLNAAMQQMNLNVQPGPSVLSAWVSSDGHYAFVEFRTAEEATSALQYLNGIQLGAYNLRIGRPKTSSDGQTAASVGSIGMPGLGLGTLGLPGLPGLGISASLGMLGVQDSNVLMIMNLPKDISEQQTRDLITPFGALKAFNLIKDKNTTVVFEYEDPSVTASAITALNSLPLSDTRLEVQRVPSTVAHTLLQPVRSNLNMKSAPTDVPDKVPTIVLRLANMVTADDLKDDELVDEIREDVEEECSKFGAVKRIVIPRPSSFQGEDNSATDADHGVGFILVEFSDVSAATAAKTQLGGRSFNGNTVFAQYFPEDLFRAETFKVPEGYSFSMFELTGQSNGEYEAPLPVQDGMD